MIKIHIENPATEQFAKTIIGPVPFYKSYCGKYLDVTASEAYYREHRVKLCKHVCARCLECYQADKRTGLKPGLFIENNP